MRFRKPEEKKMNILRLLPAFLLVVAVFFTGLQTYRYTTGLDQDPLWVIVGAVATLYFSIRTFFSVRQVFVWGDEAQE